MLTTQSNKRMRLLTQVYGSSMLYLRDRANIRVQGKKAQLRTVDAGFYNFCLTSNYGQLHDRESRLHLINSRRTIISLCFA